MKSAAIASLIVMVMLAACSSTSTPTPTALASPIPVVAEPAPTLTPTATPDPTGTPTSTPLTPTAVPTAAATLAPGSTLSVQGAMFLAGGQQVVLRGVVLPRFVFPEAAVHPARMLQVFRREIDIIVGMGANFAVVEWNSGKQFLGNPDYVDNLVAALEYARSQGLYTELVLHSRGARTGSNAGIIQIDRLDSRIVTDWQSLLQDPSVSSRIAASVDLYGTLAEARVDATGKIPSLSDPILAQACKAIRGKIHNTRAICTYSAGEWGGDASELVREAIPVKQNVVIEVHPYLWIATRPGREFMKYAAVLQNKGFNVLAGEMGGSDSIQFDQQLIKYLNRHAISYAYYAIDIESAYPHHVYNKSGMTVYGKLMQDYFTGVK